MNVQKKEGKIYAQTRISIDLFEKLSQQICVCVAKLKENDNI